MQCGAAENPPTARFGVGIGNIFMTNVQCTNGDNCIEECTHSTFTSGCTHSRDVSVRCAGNVLIYYNATYIQCM